MLKVRKGYEKLLDWVTLPSVLVWGCLIIRKIIGDLPDISWVFLTLGFVIVPIVFIVVFFVVIIADGIVYQLTRKMWNEHIKEHALWDALYGFTLNDIGRHYGIKRESGEGNRSFEARLLKVAREAKFIMAKKGEWHAVVSDKGKTKGNR